MPCLPSSSCSPAKAVDVCVQTDRGTKKAYQQRHMHGDTSQRPREAIIYAIKNYSLPFKEYVIFFNEYTPIEIINKKKYRTSTGTSNKVTNTKTGNGRNWSTTS
jgi:hypothetical protein